MSDEIIRIGILGAADIAQRMVIPNIITLENFQLVGVASTSEERAMNVKNMFGCRVFRSYTELLEENLDAVYIPLPNALHFEWVDAALSKGLHVLVEKSLACTLHEVEVLNKKAQELGLVLLENFQFQSHSQMQFAMNLIDIGKLGELRAIHSCFGFPPFPDSKNIRYSKKLGGGALLDAGAYPIKIAQLLLGLNLKVESAVSAHSENCDVDIWGSAFLIEQNTNVSATISYGFDNSYLNKLEVWGSKGRLTLHRVFTAGPNFTPKATLEINNTQEEISLQQDNHFRNFLNYFYNLIVCKCDRNIEYLANINQAKLLSDVRKKGQL